MTKEERRTQLLSIYRQMVALSPLLCEARDLLREEAGDDSNAFRHLFSETVGAVEMGEYAISHAAIYLSVRLGFPKADFIRGTLKE